MIEKKHLKEYVTDMQLYWNGVHYPQRKTLHRMFGVALHKVLLYEEAICNDYFNGFQSCKNCLQFGYCKMQPGLEFLL